MGKGDSKRRKTKRPARIKSALYRLSVGTSLRHPVSFSTRRIGGAWFLLRCSGRCTLPYSLNGESVQVRVVVCSEYKSYTAFEQCRRAGLRTSGSRKVERSEKGKALTVGSSRENRTWQSLEGRVFRDWRESFSFLVPEVALREWICSREEQPSAEEYVALQQW